MSGHPWPLFDLRVRTPQLELRMPTDDDLLALAEEVRAGVIADDRTFFVVAWHALPSPALERQFLQHWWRVRGSWKPNAWHLPLTAVYRGRPVGIQSMLGEDFAIRRTIASGSWLGKAHQGHGLGTEMRAAMLALAFEGLGATAAESGYFPGNAASARVSEKVGYRPNGEKIWAVEGKRLVEQMLICTPETWNRDLVPVTIEGLEPCLPLFGVGELGPNDWATF
jgi:RimJ/RimL family protein N-acetyltransferase